MKPFSKLAAALLALMAAAHLARLVTGFAIVVAGASIPTWVSAIGLLITGGLAVMVWRESAG